jgi:hypothetical protein
METFICDFVFWEEAAEQLIVGMIMNKWCGF